MPMRNGINLGPTIELKGTFTEGAETKPTTYKFDITPEGIVTGTSEDHTGKAECHGKLHWAEGSRGRILWCEGSGPTLIEVDGEIGEIQQNGSEFYLKADYISKFIKGSLELSSSGNSDIQAFQEFDAPDAYCCGVSTTCNGDSCEVKSIKVFSLDELELTIEANGGSNLPHPSSSKVCGLHAGALERIGSQINRSSDTQYEGTLVYSLKPCGEMSAEEITFTYDNGSEVTIWKGKEKRKEEQLEEAKLWTEHTAKSGRAFWYNKMTKESVWEKPVVVSFAETIAVEECTNKDVGEEEFANVTQI